MGSNGITIPKPNRSMNTVRKIMNSEPVRGLSSSMEAIFRCRTTEMKVGRSLAPARLESYLPLQISDMGWAAKFQVPSSKFQVERLAASKKLLPPGEVGL